MHIRRCELCRHGDRATDGDGSVFYYCREKPPMPVWTQDGLVWRIPPMLASGWCGRFRVSMWRLLRSIVRNGPRA